ncbi:PA3496 family putative envelope integrity protein [Thaumasiovibrio sp. DFM-14]
MKRKVSAETEQVKESKTSKQRQAEARRKIEEYFEQKELEKELGAF